MIIPMETNKEGPYNLDIADTNEAGARLLVHQSLNLSNDQSTTTTELSENLSTIANKEEITEDVSHIEESEKYFDAPESYVNEGLDRGVSPKGDLVLTTCSKLAAEQQQQQNQQIQQQPSSISTAIDVLPPKTEEKRKVAIEIKEQQKPLPMVEKRTFKMGINSNRLKDLLMMQLDLIGHQQLKIMEKDKQIISLQNEKEQLEAKLSRMERRISIQNKRHQLEISGSQEETGGNLSLATRSRVISSPLLKSPLVVSSISKKSETDSKSIAADKLNTLPVTVTSCNDKGFCFENFLRTNVTYLDPPIKRRLCSLDKVKVEKVEGKHVPVPPWRLIEPKNVESIEIDIDNFEDTTDAAYDKRHSKPEQEEKRRKRWDLQQARQQRQHEMLVQKYMERQKGKLQGCTGDFLSPSKSSKQCNINNTNNAVDTLIKEGDSVYAVEVTEIVPVCAFGYPLPSLTPRELELPWFNIAKREVQLRTARERLVTRSKKKAIITRKKRRSCRT